MKIRNQVLLKILVGLLASSVIFFYRINGLAWTRNNILRFASDGIFVVGIMILCFTGLAYVNKEGGFNGLGYTVKYLKDRFTGAPLETYGAYLEKKEPKKYIFSPNLIVAGLFFVIAIILAICA